MCLHLGLEIEIPHQPPSVGATPRCACLRAARTGRRDLATLETCGYPTFRQG